MASSRVAKHGMSQSVDIAMSRAAVSVVQDLLCPKRTQAVLMLYLHNRSMLSPTSYTRRSARDRLPPAPWRVGQLNDIQFVEGDGHLWTGALGNPLLAARV